jgi:sulfur carrier protein ThiS
MGINVKAGKVPGTMVELELNGGPFTVLQVMELAAEEIGRKRGLGRPAFEIHTGDYQAGSRNMVDVPQLNGRMLAEKEGDRWVNIQWDTPVSDADIVLVVPKIQGNQFTVTVGRRPGSSEEVCIYSPDDEEAGPDAGTAAHALEVAGITLAPDECVEVNGAIVPTSHALNPGDTVVVRKGERAPEPEPTVETDPLQALVQYVEGLKARIAKLEEKEEVVEPVPPVPSEDSVIFGRLGEQLRTVNLEEEDTSVQDLLDNEGDLGEYEAVLYNGSPLSEDEFEETYLKAGDSVIVVPTTKRGRRIKFELR